MFTLPIILTLATVLVLFIFFARQSASTELLALGAVSFLVATQVLDTKQLLSVFSNPAAMTVAAMFILSAALEKTGVIDYLGQITLSLSNKSNILALGLIFLLAFGGSFFINNTSIVLIMIPVMITLAHNIDLPASKLLIPLSYVSILGGTCTLIGTSTNLLVDGVGRSMGIEAFNMFEILVPGLAMAGVGALYLLTIGRHILPVRESLSEFFAQNFKRQYITQIYVSDESELDGLSIRQAGFTPEKGYEVVRIIPKEEEQPKGTIARFFGGSDIAKIFREKIESKNFSSDVDMDAKLSIGDRLVVMTTQKQILNLTKDELREEAPAQNLSESDVQLDQTITMEGIVSPNSNFAGKMVRDLRLGGDVYNVHVMAVHRQKGKISSDFDQVVLGVGDTLLLRGRESELKRIFDNDELLNLSKPAQEPYNYRKAPIAIGAIIFAVGLAAFDIFPIAGAAFVAAVLVVLSGCLKNNDAYKALHGEVLLLIYAMLAISVAMEKTGALAIIVHGVMGLLEGLPPFVIVSMLYLFTSILTEVFSNNASAVMITPIAIGLAQEMGVDPKAFAATIMLGASASFATPIGYQTNTLVFNAGGYRFTDYVKVGLPLNILLWMTASFVIPWYWEL